MTRDQKLRATIALIAGVLAVLVVLGVWYIETHGPWGTFNRVNREFEEWYYAFIIVTFFLLLGFPAVPWMFATPSRIWTVTMFMLFILFLFLPVGWMTCTISNCGQGAIALGLLLLVWIGVGTFTSLSAVLASYKRERRINALEKT